jgi:hypothetical protein
MLERIDPMCSMTRTVCVHNNVEWDKNKGSSESHGNKIKASDPDSEVKLNTL